MFDFDYKELVLLIPELTLLLFSIVILLVDSFFNIEDKKIHYYLSQIALFLATVFIIVVYFEPTQVIFSNSVIIDKLGNTFKILACIFSTTLFFYAKHYLRVHNILTAEFFSLSLISVLGAMVIISGVNLLSIYLGIEILSISLYVLIAMGKHKKVSIEAALKYFILGAVASAILLYGLSMLYGITGSLDLSVINANNSIFTLKGSNILLINFSLIFLFIAVCFKLGVVPFHMWVPDVYQGAPTTITTFMGTIPKLAIFIFIVRLFTDSLGIFFNYWGQLFFIVGIISIMTGSLLAILQKNIKRMLAYSTISHMGFIFIAIANGYSGLAPAAFYLFIYIFNEYGYFWRYYDVK